jgi:hypothetical protein
MGACGKWPTSIRKANLYQSDLFPASNSAARQAALGEADRASPRRVSRLCEPHRLSTVASLEYRE